MLQRFGKITLLGLAVVLMLQTAAMAMDNNHGSKEVTSRLDLLKTEAAKATRHAAELESLNRSTVSWRTHVSYLNDMKGSVNRMADLVADLHDIKPEANPVQSKAIDQTSPKLAAAAGELTQAIKMLNEDRAATRDEEYKQSLRDLLEHASDFHSSLDAFLDYNEAKLRVERVM